MMPTTLRITLQEWEIPDTLRQIGDNMQAANDLLTENKALLQKVLDSNEDLKRKCVPVVKILSDTDDYVRA